ncbi:MAG: cytochrome c [Candidatus Omnitrophica bacterium]|nr:cytochrome c [Candidatus Omnitrophota bacterium]
MKIRWLFFPAILLLIVGAVSKGGESPPSDQEELVFYRRGDPDRGREKFIQLQCIQCHRVQADPDLTDPEVSKQAPLLGSFTHNRTPDELSKAILTPIHNPGKDKITVMPNYEDKISPQDLIDLVTYLRTVQE